MCHVTLQISSNLMVERRWESRLFTWLWLISSEGSRSRKSTPNVIRRSPQSHRTSQWRKAIHPMQQLHRFKIENLARNHLKWKYFFLIGREPKSDETGSRAPDRIRNAVFFPETLKNAYSQLYREPWPPWQTPKMLVRNFPSLEETA